MHSKVRVITYTANSIYSLNKKIRTARKNKQSFEKQERLLDYLVVITQDFENYNWIKLHALDAINIDSLTASIIL